MFSQFFLEWLQNKKHILLISHHRPDGDAFGSLEAMRGLLENVFPDKKIDVFIDRDDLDDTHIVWILGETYQDIPQGVDGVVLLDAALLSRTTISEKLSKNYDIISIDHHEMSENSVV